MVVVGGEDTCTHELIRTRSLLPDVCGYSASWNASIRGMSRAFFFLSNLWGLATEEVNYRNARPSD